LCFARHLLLHETLYARISLASSIVLIPHIVHVIYTKFHWAQRFTSMGRTQQYTYVASRNFASRKPHSSPPSLSFSPAQTTTPFPIFHKLIPHLLPGLQQNLSTNQLRSTLRKNTTEQTRTGLHITRFTRNTPMTS